MPLIYRHTCNMVDKTHRNFAFARPFSIYLACFFFLCLHRYQTPFLRIDRRKLRRMEENDELSEKKNGTEESKAMCPLCLCNTIVVTQINKQTEKNHLCPSNTYTHSQAYTFKSSKRMVKNAGKPKERKRYLFHFVYLAIVCVFLLTVFRYFLPNIEIRKRKRKLKFCSCFASINA